MRTIVFSQNDVTSIELISLANGISREYLYFTPVGNDYKISYIKLINCGYKINGPLDKKMDKFLKKNKISIDSTFNPLPIFYDKIKFYPLYCPMEIYATCTNLKEGDEIINNYINLIKHNKMFKVPGSTVHSEINIYSNRYGNASYSFDSHIHFEYSFLRPLEDINKQCPN